jgi:hypothetical protein
VGLVALVGGALLLAPAAHAAQPASGSIGPATGGDVFWMGTGTAGGADGEANCVEGVSCDSYTLTVTGTAADWAHRKVRVELGWGSPTSDFDMFIHQGSASGPVVASSASGVTTREAAFIDPSSTGTGTYVVRVVYFTATLADQYSGAASVVETFAPTASSEPAPRYAAFPAPGGLGASAGEPTLGVNWQSGNVMFIAGLQTLRVSFDDRASPARTAWTNVSALNTSLQTFDPILFTDSDAGGKRTNRTLVSQLLPTKVSLMSFTDDDGESWTPSQGSGINSGVDHQTVGGGPFTPDVPLRGPLTAYPHAVYYASQDIGLAQIALSRDGGLTFEVAVPMWTLAQCGGLHGHIKVAPDGTVYVPNKNCGGEQGFAVSTDNGLTWAIRTVPGSSGGNTDPSIGIASDGTVYFAYANGDGRARVAVTRNRGQTFLFDQDVGAQAEVRNTVFPAAVAGDPDRAAFFFLGTATGGDGVGVDPTFPGAWYPFISTTYDGGRTWVTTNVTPGDPVQRGSVCTNGTTCPSDPVPTRNLLDFNDLTLDAQGRPLAGFADGCITPACVAGQDRNGDGAVNSFDNDGAELGTILRQTGGRTLFAAYDAQVSSLPAAPALTAGLNGARVDLAWSTPDDGGSALTSYRVYRGNAGGGPEALLATVPAGTNSYVDAQGSAAFAYRVSAVSAAGEGARSLVAVPVVAESACRLPGVTVARDTQDAAPNVPLAGAVDVQSLALAEPAPTGGAGAAGRLVFTLAVKPGALPPASQWYVLWNRTAPDGVHDRNYVAMRTNLMGQPSFEHGRISYPLVYTAPATNQGNIPTAFGQAQGSHDAATGVIRITVDAAQVDGVGAGATLVGLEARTFLGRNDTLPVNQNLASDFAVGAPYTLVGSASCVSPPAAPSQLVASTPAARTIALAWRDNSADEQAFVIERATGTPDAPFTALATVGANVTSFTDATAAKKTTYFYRVRARNGSGASAPSNVVGLQRKG